MWGQGVANLTLTYGHICLPGVVHMSANRCPQEARQPDAHSPSRNPEPGCVGHLLPGLRAENGGRTSTGRDPLGPPGVSAPAVLDLRF